MWIKKVSVIAMLFAALAMILVGCASRQSSEYYGRGQAQQIQTVLLGEVVGVRNVQIEGTKTPAGTVVGAIMGGASGVSMWRIWSAKTPVALTTARALISYSRPLSRSTATTPRVKSPDLVSPVTAM